MGIDISSKLYQSHARGSERGLTLIHWCPGCKGPHLINVEKPNHLGAVWVWDGNADVPTFNPSINIVGHCHYFIHGGQIQFCGDSKHALANQTVPLPDLPKDW